MKTKLTSSLSLLAVVTLCLTALPGRAQDTVTISAAEFQRMVYSAHLHTQLAEKPELDASLQVLLELHRRNPNANPAALADLSRQALQRYRTNAPAYIRTSAFRDEILAAYLDALRQIPARTNFVQANLQLLNGYMLSPDDYTNASPAELIHSGNQRLLSSEGEATKRQAVADACMARSQGNAAFATAMDGLLLPETPISVSDTPAAIIGNTNSALHGNVTMQTLLAHSAASGNGSLTISSNQLMNLFSAETQTLWDTIHTNLALQVEFNQSQPDLLAYLTNQSARTDWEAHVAEVQQGQARTIASATVAILVQSDLQKARAPLLTLPGGKLPGQITKVVSSLGTFAEAFNKFNDSKSGKAAKLAASGNMLGAGMALFNLFTGAESPEDTMVREIDNIKTLIQDLSENMNYRFDRVDQSLTTIFDTLNEEFSKIEITLDAQGRQIARLNGNVDEIRRSLVDVQTGLHRLERELFIYFNDVQRNDLILALNGALFYETYNPAPMSYATYSQIPNGPENTFYTYATDLAQNAASSPSSFTAGDLAGSALEQQIAARPLDANLNYIKQFLNTTLGRSTAGTPPLSNPRDWFTSAYAYLQLAEENPTHFRTKGLRIPTVISKGENLTNFFRSLTFTGNNINWPLHNALGNYYVQKLTNFANQVSATEQQYASANGFALNTWRQWSAAAPRVIATATEVLAAPEPPPPIPRDAATRIAAGGDHCLALKADGSLVGWGRNDYGQTTIPTRATNVVALAAGGAHNLAIKADGTIVGWGGNSSGQTNIPAGLNNVAAVAAGGWHSLALRTNGTVVGWGNNTSGQTNSPPGLNNVTAIAAGAAHSLALKTDGSVVGWGAGGPQPVGYALSFDDTATNHVFVQPNAALDLTSGTIEFWVNRGPLVGNACILANRGFTFAQTRYSIHLSPTNIGLWNGSVYKTVPFVSTTGQWYHVAVVLSAATAQYFVNGLPIGSTTNGINTSVSGKPFTIGATFDNSGTTNLLEPFAGQLDEVRLWNVARSPAEIQANMNYGLTGAESSLVAYYRFDQGAGAAAANSAISTGSALNGTLHGPTWVPGWGEFGQSTIPNGLTSVMAIAAGAWHSLALKSNGTVVAWGRNDSGQTNVPVGLANVVAIAAGGAHSLALRADGTVMAWGAGPATQVPLGLTGVMAIATGWDHALALKADGTVVAWGRIYERQCLVPPALTWQGAIAASDAHSLALKADGSVVGWGGNYYGQLGIPPSATNVVAIAAGDAHSLALKADGSVVGWGLNDEGQTNSPAGLANVVAIAAGGLHSLALKADGSVVGWGDNGFGQTNIPVGLTNVVAIAAGARHNLALKTDGTVVAWGNDFGGGTNVPAGLTNVMAIAASGGQDVSFSLALKADGSVVDWGSSYDYHDYGQTTIPASATNVMAIAAGGFHSLALKADGSVLGWGWTNEDQTTIPASAVSGVVAIAAGGYHSLALKADGSVVGWGRTNEGQTTIHASAASGVVAIAAGGYHSLALKADGSVVGWGDNSYGQRTIPASATNGVVAIAAGEYHSLALKAAGSVVSWGDNGYGQTTIPASAASGVVAIAAGGYHSLFLKSVSSTNSPQGLSFVRAQIPRRMASLFRAGNTNLVAELGPVGSLNATATELSGAKALLSAVLELGMPYTLERDDVLHGFLYGSESLVDLNAGLDFLGAENLKLQTSPNAAPQALTEVAVLRYLRFQDRLNLCLTNLQATGQPEIPRLVGHTLRLLNLLRDSWATVPPPALEMWSENNSPRLLLYGEPYARYTLQYSDSLSAPGWTTTTVTNWRNEQIIVPPVSGTPQRYYRVMLPVP